MIDGNKSTMGIILYEKSLEFLIEKKKRVMIWEDSSTVTKCHELRLYKQQIMHLFDLLLV